MIGQRDSPLWKMGAYAVIKDQAGRVLLIHRTDVDVWQSPGGGVEFGEAPSEAVIREVREESGYTCKIVDLLGIDLGLRSRNVWFSYQCEITGGQATKSTESDEIEYFELDRLPLVTPATRFRLAMLRRAVSRPWVMQHDDL